MSDVEIIEAMRLSDAVLESAPVGILSIVAHYSRPNVYTFSGDGKIAVTGWHFGIKEKPVEKLCDGRGLSRVHRIIGAIGDNIYLTGVGNEWKHILASFNLRTLTFMHCGVIERLASMCISPADHSIYVCRGYDRTGSNLGFYKRNLITFKDTELPAMIVTKFRQKLFFYNGSVYVLGGLDKTRFTTAVCERFDVKENKWYSIAPMPYPAEVMSVAAGEGNLTLITTKPHTCETYDPIENKWTILSWDETYTQLSIGALQYNNEKFLAVSNADEHNPEMVVWEFTSPEKVWNSVLKLEGIKPRMVVQSFLHFSPP